MTDRDWDKEMAKIDKQLESVSDKALFPEKSGAAPAAKEGSVADMRATTRSWPAILRLVLSVSLGVAVLWWPFASRCGGGLAGYLLAVLAVSASGVWSAVWTWRHRTARAHVLSILLIAWGLLLASSEVLPRMGYAKVALSWSCEVTTP